MRPRHENPNQPGCNACGFVEPASNFTSNVAHFANSDDRTDACLRRCGIEVPIGDAVRLCRRHAVALERELTTEYGVACPYVQPLPHTPRTVGVDTRPQRAMLTTWVGDSFLPPAVLGPNFRLFGQHRAHRVSVEFEGRTYSGIWLPDCQDFVRLKAVP